MKKSIFAAQQLKKAKPVVLANNKPERYEKWEGLTLLDVDEFTRIHKVSIGFRTVEVEGEERKIASLLVGLAKETVAFPFSKSIDIDEFLADEEALVNGKFYMTKKMVEGDEEGAPTGDLYICFGKPSTISYDEEQVLVDGEAVDTN